MQQKTIQVTKQRHHAIERMALHALQKHLHILQLREWLVLVSITFGAALLRIPMQVVPSAEPITTWVSSPPDPSSPKAKITAIPSEVRPESPPAASITSS